MMNDATKGVKLFSWRRDSSSDWIDYKRPPDYYGQAQQIAKQYMKQHPEADRETVYMAASEAAAYYDVGVGGSRRMNFRTAVQVKIRTVLFNAKRRNNEMGQKFSDEMKAEILEKYEDGISAGNLADEYHLKETQIRGIVQGMRAKERREAGKAEYISHFETEEPPCGVPMDAPEDEPAEQEPEDEAPAPEPEKPLQATAKPTIAESLSKIGKAMNNLFGFPETTVEVPEDDGPDMFELLSDMREWVETKFGEHVPISMRAANDTEVAQYHFRDPRTGKAYRVTICKQWEEDEEEELTDV